MFKKISTFTLILLVAGAAMLSFQQLRFLDRMLSVFNAPGMAFRAFPGREMTNSRGEEFSDHNEEFSDHNIDETPTQPQQVVPQSEDRTAGEEIVNQAQPGQRSGGNRMMPPERGAGRRDGFRGWPGAASGQAISWYGLLNLLAYLTIWMFCIMVTYYAEKYIRQMSCHKANRDTTCINNTVTIQ